jgi:hypothetical protein
VFGVLDQDEGQERENDGRLVIIRFPISFRFTFKNVNLFIKFILNFKFA